MCKCLLLILCRYEINVSLNVIRLNTETLRLINIRHQQFDDLMFHL
jgi:hypothetical protein